MFAKRLIQKAVHRHQHHEKGLLASEDLKLRINLHYGVPSTASILAFDSIQRLLAIGTLDGRIKVIGGDNIEGLLISPKLVPYKYLEFLQNQGFLVSITNDNDIQVWNLQMRSIACSFQWESNVTAFSVISGSSFMYVGDEYGFTSVLKYDSDSGELLKLHYQLSSDSLAEAIGFSISNRQPIVGLLPQPCSSGNRLLIAYESGLIILWDVVEAHVVIVRGDKVLQLKNRVVPPNDIDTNIQDDEPSHDLEKEISALCWVSADGSILAVGYIDGDILFWNTSKDSSVGGQETRSSSNVVRLQLSSAEKRLPIIVLHWLDDSKSCHCQGGQLLVYGGDEIGCEEVVTVLSLEWSSGIEAVRCIGRVDLTLTGSFADMILIPSAGTTGSDANVSLFVLSNPGRIHIYDRGSLSSSDLQSREELPISAISFPAGIPTVDPLMTVAELFLIHGTIEGIEPKASFYATCAFPIAAMVWPANKKWPLTGGVSNHISFGKDKKVQRLYVAGYQDGSVRIWDATYPVLSLLCILTNEVYSEDLVDSGASLTSVELCSSTLRLAVGSECGLVQLYNLCSSNGTSFHFVTETKREVRSSSQVQGPRCEAVLYFHKSGVQALKFTSSGLKLIIGYECSRIAVIDVHSFSVAFITESISNSPVISVLWKTFAYEMAKSTESVQKIPDNSTGEHIFILTKDASIYVTDSCGMIISRPVQLKKSTAISLHVIESQAASLRSVDDKQSPKDGELKNEFSQSGAQGSEKCEAEEHSLDKIPSAQSLKESFVLLCCNDSLRIYPAKSVVQGESKSIYKVKLPKPCCWTTIFKKDEKVCGLVVFYQTGVMEIRSLPDLELVKEFSFMSDLRWNFKSNMERMISSTENGHIVLANGSEVAFISLLVGENDFRIPESLPNLHDEVLEAAANAAISVSSDSKRKQGGNLGILGGIVKGFRGRRSDRPTYHDSNSKSNFDHLEEIFMTDPFPESSTTTDEQGAAELTIDDIVIDEPVPLVSTSSHEVKNKDKDQKSEREKLFDDGADVKPRLRTREEIIATYRKAGDASSVAGQARNKLLERQEKLERISRQTEDLRNGAEDFASLANELVKAMENRKWYHI
ncbi:Syntaxin-binding protein 5-like [Sesamum alatum]|uniref:Syntaxin-binding protein 5-like n=1 Tax=Sesamum alatum TaxID=300844 RepID=A0AAE2CE85_9LAMI|nr:Syntaxin-binding protein 5-like [Sesamum alatum]